MFGMCSLCIESTCASRPHQEIGDASKTACEWGERPSDGQSWTDFQVETNGIVATSRCSTSMFREKKADRIRLRPGQHQLSTGTAERMMNGTPAVFAHGLAPLSTSEAITADGLPPV